MLNTCVYEARIFRWIHSVCHLYCIIFKTPSSIIIPLLFISTFICLVYFKVGEKIINWSLWDQNTRVLIDSYLWYFIWNCLGCQWVGWLGKRGVWLNFILPSAIPDYIHKGSWKCRFGKKALVISCFSFWKKL